LSILSKLKAYYSKLSILSKLKGSFIKTYILEVAFCSQWLNVSGCTSVAGCTSVGCCLCSACDGIRIHISGCLFCGVGGAYGAYISLEARTQNKKRQKDVSKLS
jgi:hypothetical protein